MPLRRTPAQREIEQLDPVQDHQRIVHLLGCYEFPWDMTRSLEVALLRTFCAPAVSALLDQTREFLDRPQKRYDDTDIIVSELIEFGYDHDRGRAALRRMNQIHGRFEIANEDFLYVLSTFIYEPIRWLDRFGWRTPSERERQAMFHFWREVGHRMAIREIPADDRSFEQYNRDYEARNLDFCESNQRVARATLGMMAGWFPRVTRPIVKSVMVAILDDTMRRCFGFGHPSPLWCGIVAWSLKLRGYGIRFLPRRRRPRMRTDGPHRSYPDGYDIQHLGPQS